MHPRSPRRSSIGSRRPSASPDTLRAAWLPLLGLSAVFLFEMLDNSVLTVALPTIATDLGSSATGLQWVTGAYSIVFGGLMLVLSAWADRVGRKRVMLLGLALLGVSSLATAFVTTTAGLIAVRVLMGVAAAMSTPGSMALAFRLFTTDALRVRAISLISTVGLVGLALGPIVGGAVLTFVPWQALLVVDAPVAGLAFVAVLLGVPADDPASLHRDPVDVRGAFLGTFAIVSTLLAPTFVVDLGASSWIPWVCVALSVTSLVVFVRWERACAHPILDLGLLSRPLVAGGLLFKSAANLAVSGLGFLITLQLQLVWGWSPAEAALGMLPQVVVLIAVGPVVAVLVRRLGMSAAAWVSSLSVVSGLAVFALFGRDGYVWIALSLVCVAAGMRVVGVVAGTNVMKGLPEDRTTVGAALSDTSGELGTSIGIALCGTILAVLFGGSLDSAGISASDAVALGSAIGWAGAALTSVAAGLVGWGMLRSRMS